MTKVKQPTVGEKWDKALEIMTKGQVSSEVMTMIEAIYAPKSASSVNPPILDDNGEMVEVWDRWFNQYVSINEAVLSNGKPKGYSKASLSKWNKIQAKIKDLTMELAFSGMTRPEVEEEMKLAQKASNSPESFDYDDNTYRFVNKIKYEMVWEDQAWVTNELPEED